MEENFEEIFKKLKEQDLNPEITKKYILKIKERVDQIKEEQGENISDSEIKKIFEKEYTDDLNLKVKASNIYVHIKKQRICKKILDMYKGNKNEFNRKMKTAKKLEEIDSKDDLALELDDEKDIIGALRGAVRSVKYAKNNRRSRYYGKTELDIIKEQEKENNELAKQYLIRGIEYNVSYLEKFGIIDDYINEANSTLEKLNLSELKYIKRNPITDDSVIPVPDGIILPFKDENGKQIQYTAEDSKVKEVDEDMGVLDNLEKANLEKLPLEELLLLHLFWESKTAEVNYEMEKTKDIINTLGIWDEIINKNKEDIENISLKDIKKGLKKDLAITYLSNDEIILTDSLVEKYIKCLGDEEQSKENENDEIKLGRVKKVFKDKKAKKELIKAKREEIISEVKRKEKLKKSEDMKENISKFEDKMADMMTLECLILEKLLSKEFKSKTKWGVIENVNDVSDNELIIGVKNSNFRGTLIMSMLKMYVQTYFQKDSIELPILKNYIDEEYAGIMAKIYLPKSKKFVKEAKNKYEENPTSSLNAEIADKKVKKEKNFEER